MRRVVASNPVAKHILAFSRASSCVRKPSADSASESRNSFPADSCSAEFTLGSVHPIRAPQEINSSIISITTTRGSHPDESNSLFAEQQGCESFLTKVSATESFQLSSFAPGRPTSIISVPTCADCKGTLSSLAGYCERCGASLCQTCVRAKGVKADSKETLLCEGCISGIFGSPTEEWSGVKTEDGKPAFVANKDGRCFSITGKFIGRFIPGK